MDNICQLCDRKVDKLTKHHLLPREEGGNEEHISYILYVQIDIGKYMLYILDKVNSNKLKEHGVKGFAFQIELSQETIDYLNNI